MIGTECERCALGRGQLGQPPAQTLLTGALTPSAAALFAVLCTELKRAAVPRSLGMAVPYDDR